MPKKASPPDKPRANLTDDEGEEDAYRDGPAVAPVPYRDQEDEWADDSYVPQQESEFRQTMKDFTGSGEKKLASQTDITHDQMVFLYDIRLLAKDFPSSLFPEFYLDDAAEWFEAYRISIGRGGRRESTEVLRGRLGDNLRMGGQGDANPRFSERIQRGW